MANWVVVRDNGALHMLQMPSMSRITIQKAHDCVDLYFYSTANGDSPVFECGKIMAIDAITQILKSNQFSTGLSTGSDNRKKVIDFLKECDIEL